MEPSHIESCKEKDLSRGGDDLRRTRRGRDPASLPALQASGHDVGKLFIGGVFILCERPLFACVTANIVRSLKVIHVAAADSPFPAAKDSAYT